MTRELGVLQAQVEQLSRRLDEVAKMAADTKQTVDHFKLRRQHVWDVLAAGRKLWMMWLALAGLIGWAIAKF